MRKGKRNVKKRIFLSNTCMVLVTLVIFLAVNLALLKLYEDTLKRKAGQSSEVAPYAEDVRKSIEEWQPATDKEQCRKLAEKIRKNNYKLCVLSEHGLIYSNVEDEEWEERDDLEKYMQADGEGHIFSDYNLTVVSRYDAASKIEIYALAGKYDEEYWIWEGNFAAFLTLFIIDGVLCVGGLLLISQLFTRNLSRHILKPLTLLLNAAERVQEGVLTQPVLYKGDVEYENVCKAFNKMQLYILREREKNHKYEKARTDMVAGISHDLRTPLTAIQGTIKGLLDGVTTTPEQQRRFLETAYRRTGDMEVLLQRLFYFSKLETGNMPLEMRIINLSEFVENYVKARWETLQDDCVHVEQHIGEGLLYAEIDAGQMQRIFDNLFENSIKYAGERFLVISISLEKVDGRVCITVSDNGCGVQEEKLPRIFEQFYRGDESRNEKEGNGLGLYIVKYLVEAMDGRVWAENKKGLAIQMEFPVAEGGQDES